MVSLSSVFHAEFARCGSVAPSHFKFTFTHIEVKPSRFVFVVSLARPQSFSKLGVPEGTVVAIQKECWAETTGTQQRSSVRMATVTSGDYVEGGEDWTEYEERLGHFFPATGRRSVLFS